jgi:PAS domain S-box-containing protein
MNEFFQKLLDTSDWPPRWHCGVWTEFHGWLYIISDFLIWSACFAIPFVIVRNIPTKKNIRFTKLYFLFAVFILACGATHFLDAVTFWIPAYRLSALIRFITGVISWVTVFYLVKYLPVIFSLPSKAALEAEIEERKKTERALKKSRKDYELLVGGVKDYAIFMLDTEGKVASWNSGAAHIKGYTAEEIIGKPLNVFYREEEIQHGEPERNLQIALQHGRFETMGWRVRKDKSVFWADIVFSALYDEDNKFYGYAKVTRDITEKRKAEERILFLASIASIASNIQDPYISTDNNGIITRWNQAAELLLEWKAEEVVGKAGAEILKIDYLQATKELVAQSFNEKNYWQGEVVYHTKSGRPINVLVTVSKLEDAEGSIAGNLTLVRDITERKTAENKLKEFEYFFNNSNDLSCIANTEGYFEIISPSFNKVLGYSESELLKIPFIDFVHPDDIAATLEASGQLKSGATIIHFINRYRKKDGNYLWLDWNTTPNATTGKLYCIARDINERKKAEDALYKLNGELEQKVIERTEKLAASEMRFRMLIENSTEGIDLSDEFSNNIYRSPGAIKITGILPKENQMSLTHPDDLEIIRIKSEELIKRPGIPIAFQARFRHALGHYIWMEGTFTNLLHVEGVHAIVTNFRDITQRKELEVLLHKANSLARIGGWEVDLVKGTVFWSYITREIHETAQDYMPDLESGINFYKEGSSRELITQKIKEAVELGTPWNVELQIITAENNERWVRSIGETEFADGKCIRIYGSFQDITDRKKAEIERERLNERLQLASQSAQLGLWDWDVKNNELIWDEAMYRLYNLTENEFTTVYDGWASRVHEEDRQRVDNEIQLALANKKDYSPEFRIVWTDSSVHYINASGIIERDSDGNAVRMTGFNWDVTERKKAEIERERLNERLQLATQSAQLGLWDWDVKNNKLIWDEAMYRLYNLTENEFTTVYDGWASRVHAEDRQRVDNDIQLALAGKKDYNPEFRIVWPDSSIHYLNATGIIERDSDGNAVRMTGFNWDVTERKEAEKKINSLNIELEQKVIQRTAQLEVANKEMEAFSYSVSHDLRAPLRAINGYANMLEEDYNGIFDTNGKRLLSTIQKNAEQMGVLIDDLLSLSRLGRKEVQKSQVDMEGLTKVVVDELMKEVASFAKVKIDRLHAALADASLIKQVLVNIISNAIKYSSKSEKPFIEISSVKEDNKIIYSIKDNGSGFDMAYANKLFGVFQRLHSHEEFEGTGVGLALVKLIIDKHQGKIWAEGKVGEGAIFHFSLPSN